MKYWNLALTSTLLIFSTYTNAALVERLGGLAYYDTDADLTWLADANYAQTSGYNENGLMIWPDAMAWAAGLDINGVTGWRLPDSNNCTGYSCSGSEMGNLFFNVLGGTTYDVGDTSYNDNYDLFSNVQTGNYWSATKYGWNPTTTSRAYYFNFDTGSTGAGYMTSWYLYAWAVQSGDVAAVSAVPIPPAVFLFGSGLIGLIGLAKRKAHS